MRFEVGRSGWRRTPNRAAATVHARVWPRLYQLGK